MICKKCAVEKMPVDFYLRDSTCKECRKAAVRANRAANIEQYRKYDRARGNRLPIGFNKNYRQSNPAKYKAHNAVNNALRDGKIKRQSCEVCGAPETHAHHDDYTKPLDVRWLCPAHHRQWHTKNGEAKTA